MDWLSSNWIWIAFGVAMIAMHMFGHGGHGGHNRQTERDPGRANDTPGAPPTAHAGTTAPKAANSDEPAARGAPAGTGRDSPPILRDGKRHHHSG